jgi:SPW repeat
MKAFSWINFILGLWLIVAGFALSATARPVMTEEIILGVIIACLAFASIMRPAPVLSWLIAIAGLWTLVAPMVMHYAVRASRGNDIIVGIIVLALGVSNAVYRQDLVRTHA